jgi:ribonuclease HII
MLRSSSLLNAAVKQTIGRSKTKPARDFASMIREAELSYAKTSAGIAANYPTQHVHVVGIDETGVGAVAGPIVAAAVYIPDGVCIPGVLDSKQLSESDRQEVFDLLVDHPDVVVQCAVEDVEMINMIGNLRAAHMNALATAYQRIDTSLCDKFVTRYGVDLRHTVLRRTAHSQLLGDSTAVRRLRVFHPVVAVIVDGSHAPPSLTAPDSHFGCIAVPKADGICPSVAAASIVAKVLRDNLMLGFHKKFPQYRFDEHKGYGTESHLLAIQEHGPCALHRTLGTMAIANVNSVTSFEAFV